MASQPSEEETLPPIKYDPLAGFLSFLIPGLGQVFQGRVLKGLIFFCGLYLLFFYGMWMGQWRNVWLPDSRDLPEVNFLGQQLGGLAKDLNYRKEFLGQFWIGIAAWPAVYQYFVFDGTKDAGPIFGTFQRMPKEEDLNVIQRNSSKRWDLGWVYTVIAGVLNLLVIYDAFAGPMFREWPRPRSKESAEPAASAPQPIPPTAPAPRQEVASAPQPIPPKTEPQQPVESPPPLPSQHGGI